MASEVSGIKLKYDPIQFDGDCIDPYAKIVINEALDFAITTSLRRLKSAGKAIAEVETRGYPALETVQGIRDALSKAPTCPRELTQTEQDTIAALMTESKEETKIPFLHSKGKVKPKPKAEKLTALEWNTMGIPARAALAAKAKLESDRGRAAFGSLTKEEIASLQLAYLEPEIKLAIKPKAKPPPTEAPLVRLILLRERSEKDPKILTQTGWGTLNAEGLQTGKISLEEGTKLLGEGKARLN